MTAKTTYEPTYWNGEGELQQIHDALWEALVPECGDAPTTHGNALRWMCKIYHEVYNNGGFNAVERRDGERALTPYYADGIALVAEVAALSQSECATLNNALLKADGLCANARPVTAKRLDAIVTKVTKAALLAHLATVKPPVSDFERTPA